MPTKKSTKKKVAKSKTGKTSNTRRPLKKRSAAAKAPTIPDLTTMRGVSSFDIEDGSILVQAPCAEVAEAIKKRKKLKTWIRNALGKPVTITGASYLVYQLRGHAWATVNTFTGDNNRGQNAEVTPQDDAKALSKSLATKALFFGNSDTSCVTEYDVYENGKLLEHFDDFNGITFRSTFRDIDPPEDGPDIYDFVNASIAEHDAFVTGWSRFLFEGWRYKAGDQVKLDFGGALDKTIIERLDFISA
jgi:hypothetical protein